MVCLRHLYFLRQFKLFPIYIECVPFCVWKGCSRVICIGFDSEMTQYWSGLNSVSKPGHSDPEYTDSTLVQRVDVTRPPLVSNLTFAESVLFLKAASAASFASWAIFLFCSVLLFKASISFCRSSGRRSINLASIWSSLSLSWSRTEENSSPHINNQLASNKGFVNVYCYKWDCFSDQVGVIAGFFQVIICFALNSLCLVNVSEDLRHVNIFCPLPTTKRHFKYNFTIHPFFPRTDMIPVL